MPLPPWEGSRRHPLRNLACMTRRRAATTFVQECLSAQEIDRFDTVIVPAPPACTCPIPELIRAGPQGCRAYANPSSPPTALCPSLRSRRARNTQLIIGRIRPSCNPTAAWPSFRHGRSRRCGVCVAARHSKWDERSLLPIVRIITGTTTWRLDARQGITTTVFFINKG